VAGTETDPKFSNNRIESFINVLPATTASDLALTMVDAPDPVRKGTNLVYTLTVQNNGPSDAGSITLSDLLPTGITFVSAVPAQGTCTGTAAVTCALGTLNAGAKTSVKITIKPKKAGVISNSASISSAIVTDPDTTNNSKTVTTTVKR
jgi:uncharacterized repeat protein (TIGR01451 family)